MQALHFNATMRVQFNGSVSCFSQVVIFKVLSYLNDLLVFRRRQYNVFLRWRAPGR